MTYDFTSIMDRHNLDASAVDCIGDDYYGMEPSLPKEGFDAIPM